MDQHVIAKQMMKLREEGNDDFLTVKEICVKLGYSPSSGWMYRRLTQLYEYGFLEIEPQKGKLIWRRKFRAKIDSMDSITDPA